MSMDHQSLSEIDEIGEKTASSITEFLRMRIILNL